MASRRSIDHPAHPHAIHEAAVHANAHEAPGTLIHHHEHPVRAPDSRFAVKQIKTPQTVLGVIKDVSQAGPAGSGFGWDRAASMRRTHPW
jgi:hypothetical protein